MERQYAVWWTNQHDCRMIWSLERSEEVAKALPEYLQKAFLERDGWTGKTRLYIPPGIEEQKVKWNDYVATCQVLDEPQLKYCGIVMFMDDVPSIIHLPGFVTTLEMRVVTVMDVIGYLF